MCICMYLVFYAHASFESINVPISLHVCEALACLVYILFYARILLGSINDTVDRIIVFYKH